MKWSVIFFITIDESRRAMQIECVSNSCEHSQIDVFVQNIARIARWCSIRRIFCQQSVALCYHCCGYEWMHLFFRCLWNILCGTWKGSHLHQCYVNPIRFVCFSTQQPQRMKESEKNTRTLRQKFYWHRNPELCLLRMRLFTNDPQFHKNKFVLTHFIWATAKTTMAATLCLSI